MTRGPSRSRDDTCTAQGDANGWERKREPNASKAHLVRTHLYGPRAGQWTQPSPLRVPPSKATPHCAIVMRPHQRRRLPPARVKMKGPTQHQCAHADQCVATDNLP